MLVRAHRSDSIADYHLNSTNPIIAKLQAVVKLIPTTNKAFLEIRAWTDFYILLAGLLRSNPQATPVKWTRVCEESEQLYAAQTTSDLSPNASAFPPEYWGGATIERITHS